MTSPDPTLPAQSVTRGSVVREVVGLLLMLLGVVGLMVVAYDVDERLAAAIGAVALIVVGWRLTAYTAEG